MRLRLASSQDCQSVIEFIDGVLREYGDEILLTGADRDLMDITAHYEQLGGAFVVLDDEGQVRGTHAVMPDNTRHDVCFLRRLYLEQALRGGEWGVRLMDWTLDWAAARGARRVELWSDTRFERAHGFFRRYGFRQDGRVREMHDGIEPYKEHFFSKGL